MKQTVIDRLVSVKSIVTILLTVVFSYLSVTGAISGQEFLTIFATIIAFYFGVQSEKKASEKEEESHA